MLKFDQFDALTFDCYGTLIDWETGIWDALRPILEAHGQAVSVDTALTLFGQRSWRPRPARTARIGRCWPRC